MNQNYNFKFLFEIKFNANYCCLYSFWKINEYLVLGIFNTIFFKQSFLRLKLNLLGKINVIAYFIPRKLILIALEKKIALEKMNGRIHLSWVCLVQLLHCVHLPKCYIFFTTLTTRTRYSSWKNEYARFLFVSKKNRFLNLFCSFEMLLKCAWIYGPNSNLFFNSQKFLCKVLF